MIFGRLQKYVAREASLSDDDFHHLVSFLMPKSLLRNESLAGTAQGRRVEGFVERGCLRIYCATPSGTDRVLDFALEGSWVSSAAGSVPGSLAIGALERTDLLVIDEPTKERLCAESPALDQFFRRLAQNSLTALQQRLLVAMQSTAEERYLAFRHFYPMLEARVAQYHIASFLGITPEFLSKLRKKLRARDVVLAQRDARKASNAALC